MNLTINVYGFEESPYHDTGERLTTADSLDAAIDTLNGDDRVTKYNHLVFLENGKPVAWRGWFEITGPPRRHAWLPMPGGDLAALQDFSLQCGLFLKDNPT